MTRMNLPSSVVTASQLAGGTLPGSFTYLGQNEVVNSRNPFAAQAVIDSSDSNTAYDFAGSQFNCSFTGQNWQSTSSPDNGFMIGASFFTATGHGAGDGNGIPTLQGMEIGVQTDSAAGTPPSAAPFNSRFNIQYVQALELAANLNGSSTVYSMSTLYVQPPGYAPGAATTRAVADGVITGTTTLTSATAAFTSGDTGATAVGTGIPYGTTITYVNGTTVTLSQACTNATGLSVAIGTGGSVLGPAYGMYVAAIDGQAVGSTNTFAIYAAGGNSYLGGPVAIDTTQMTLAKIGLNPSAMASRSGVVGSGVAGLTIKIAQNFAGRLLDIWGPVVGNSTYDYFGVTNNGAVVAVSTMTACNSQNGMTAIGSVGTGSASGIAFGTSSGTDSVLQRIAAGVLGHPGPIGVVQSTQPSQISGSGVIWVNSGDGTLHYMNPSGTDNPVQAGGPTAGSRQIVISCFGTPQSAGAHAWTYSVASGEYANGIITNNTTPAVNDSVEFWSVWLDAGTWQLDLMGETNTDGGQITAALVGGSTFTFSGNQEQYAASPTVIRSTLTGLSVTTAGLYSLQLTIATKNASSTGYRCRMSECVLTRTA